ncbi:hypothetical protein KEM09_02100 [Carboxylicivirga mesophila]|uniref:Uncharacterized protein n=1 Tax=Carboxylicivirga mesophila TaxID=1166478 RepID=A0ABS5K5E0_9BACT|nr:hypothetical protein [Carboxylicivirga mesophila]MBS2210172.1 hypothetical protein [Carboxylicivirga mesophila]
MQLGNMRVLIYKRTHKGDPDDKGVFGNQDCMGRIRNWDYDAVIGIGGKTTFKGDEDIKYKINWIGLKPQRFNSESKRGNYVAFSHFALFEEKGEEINYHYPHLFVYMYSSRKRFDMASELPSKVYEEVLKILDSVKSYPPSNFEITDVKELESECITHDSQCINSCGEPVQLTIDEQNCRKPSS